MAISLRTDFDSSPLRAWAKKAKGGPQARRLLALPAIYDGATRTEVDRRCDAADRSRPGAQVQRS
jgi:hypothetical protein